MNRREWLSTSAAAGLPWLAISATNARAAQPPAGKLAPLKITDIKTILTAPAGIRLVVVKVLTSEPGLYGLGCATFTQRVRPVEVAVNQYLRPFLIGKDPTLIEDTWQSCFVSSYWRSGPDFHDQAATYASSRTPGATYQLDPESPGRYYRSVAGNLGLTTVDVTGAPFAPPPTDPPSDPPTDPEP